MNHPIQNYRKGQQNLVPPLEKLNLVFHINIIRYYEAYGFTLDILGKVLNADPCQQKQTDFPVPTRDRHRQGRISRAARAIAISGAVES